MQTEVLIIPVYWRHLIPIPKNNLVYSIFTKFYSLSNESVFLCWLENVHPSDTSFWIEIRPIMSVILMDYQNYLSLEIMLCVIERLHCAQRVAPFWWGQLWGPFLSHCLHSLKAHWWCQCLTLLLCNLTCMSSFLSVTFCQNCRWFGTMQLDKARDQAGKIKEK